MNRTFTNEKPINRIFFFFAILIFISFFINKEATAQSKMWTPPSSADNLKNPLAGNTAVLKDAKVLYTSYCTPCHGMKGKGDGVAAAAMNPKPANHTSEMVQHHTDGGLYWMISTGQNPMPTYKSALSEKQRWELVNYIRTLAAVKRPTKTTPVRANNVPAKAVSKHVMVMAHTDTSKIAVKTGEAKKDSTPVEANTLGTQSDSTTDTVNTLDDQTNSSRSIGQNKFAVFGNAEATYTATKGQSSFGDVSFKPIFLWKISDKLFAEAEIEIETGEGTANLGLEYANMCYMVNPYLIVHAGRFLPKFGAYRGRGGEAFLNRFASDPAGFGDGGIGAMNETGIGAEGGLPFGDIKINYDFYISNGPQLQTDTLNAGQFDYEAYTSNNKSSAIGGRIAILPFQNSSLEIGYSFQSKSKTGEVGTPYQNVGVVMQAIDLNYLGHLTALKSDIRIIGEWKHQKVGNATYKNGANEDFSFYDAPTSYYACATLRPSHVDNKFVSNLELAGRYSYFNRPSGAPWGGTNDEKVELALDYWLKWNCLVKFCYVKQKDNPSVFNAQFVFGF
ncbi:MAG TPA: cytochrome c [Hanamia sp.]